MFCDALIVQGLYDCPVQTHMTSECVGWTIVAASYLVSLFQSHHMATHDDLSKTQILLVT